MARHVTSVRAPPTHAARRPTPGRVGNQSTKMLGVDVTASRQVRAGGGTHSCRCASWLVDASDVLSSATESVVPPNATASNQPIIKLL